MAPKTPGAGEAPEVGAASVDCAASAGFVRASIVQLPVVWPDRPQARKRKRIRLPVIINQPQCHSIMTGSGMLSLI
jgi:hypothetical protein